MFASSASEATVNYAVRDDNWSNACISNKYICVLASQTSVFVTILSAFGNRGRGYAFSINDEVLVCALGADEGGTSVGFEALVESLVNTADDSRSVRCGQTLAYCAGRACVMRCIGLAAHGGDQRAASFTVQVVSGGAEGAFVITGVGDTMGNGIHGFYASVGDQDSGTGTAETIIF